MEAQAHLKLQKRQFVPHLEVAFPLCLVVNTLIPLESWTEIGTTISKSLGKCCHLRKKLQNQEQPTARERREVIHSITAKILATPVKKHLSEVAQKMVLEYRKSFKDIIEDEIIGSGYDSFFN